MWPQTLEMSRDECRGMLRRLELESYSHIISVFRAQGSLSEPKAKLLEELRQLFHITQERHRAEVRRATNDEQLCTIAENVCGPNTWQEWSREGRRPYPLLPRIHPQTALSIVANDLAAKALAENVKLAAPAETGANLTEALLEQAKYQALKYGHKKCQEPHIIMEEPFKVPDLPNEIKKATLKRKENEAGDGKPNKKRNTQQLEKSGRDEDEQAAPLEQRANARTLQQRYFYQQQQKYKQRLASKKGAGNTLANHSGLAGVGVNTKPAKSGRRRAQKQLQQQLQQKQQQEQQQQQLQQQQQQQQKVLLPAPAQAAAEPAVSAAQPNANHLVQPHVEYILDEALKSVAATKLKTVPAARVVYGPPEVLSPTAARAFVNSPIVFKEKLSPTVQPLQQQPVQQQQQQQQPVQQQLSTPVKKYIVEERQQVAVTATQPNLLTANLPLSPQIISVQQITGPPKVRSSSAILPPGTKLTPKKINLLEKQQLPTVSNTAVRLLPYGEAQTQPQMQTQSLSTPVISNLSSSKPPATAAVQKYIVEERVPSQPSPAVATPLSSASAVNIIKNIPASSLNNTLITPLSNSVSPVSPLFRKATGPTVATTTTTTAAAGASGSAQLLGNIKLTTSSSTIKCHVPSSALRNIKICSPNGKVFLQPAKLHAGSIIHKLNPTNSSALSPTTAGSPTSPQPTPQRITIQKMQLVSSTSGVSPTSSGSSSGGVVTKVKPTTLTLGPGGVGKNNLVFLPTSGMRAVTLASNKPKPQTAAELLAAKPNVLVIGPSSAASSSSASVSNPVSNTQTIVATSPSSSSSMLGKSKAHQLITEDTPIDIINMPIIVADNGTTEPKPAAKTTPMVVFNATDWEMELDQASKAAAATSISISSGSTSSSSCSTTPTITTSKFTNASNSKHTLDDVIVEDSAEEVEQSTTLLNNRIIELQEDDDSTIEYVDMELEQPIEIQRAGNISTERMKSVTSLKSSIVGKASVPATGRATTMAKDQKKIEQATKEEREIVVVGGATPKGNMKTMTVTVSATSTLP